MCSGNYWEVGVVNVKLGWNILCEGKGPALMGLGHR